MDRSRVSRTKSLAQTGTSVLAVLSACVAFPAAAQQDDTATDVGAPVPDLSTSDQSGGAIVVTGTRLGGFTAPTPLTSLGTEALENKAIQSVTDLIYDIPALTFNQNNSQVSEAIGASNLDLRSLGPKRTLLLLDGRRFAATDPSGGVDISVIPTALIKQVDIVTGGASAAYGSDAVSGVVNIELDDRFEGIRGTLQYGQTTHNDHHSPSASLAVGKAFFDDRLHVVVSGDYYENDGQLSQAERDWGNRDYALLTNPAYTPSNGEPQRLVLPNSTTSQLTYGGVTALSNPANLRGIQFGPGGTVLPFNYGTNVGNTFMTGGDGETPMTGANITPEYQRISGFGKVSFEISDTATIYADMLWARSDAFADQLPNPDPGNLVIQRDNAYLPESVRALIPADGTLRIGRLNGEDGVFSTNTVTTVARYGAGVTGTVGDGNWNYDAFVQLFRNDYDRKDFHNRNEQKWLQAVDAVYDPASESVRCRINVDMNPANDDPACVAANVFGAGSISPEAVAYYTGTSTLQSKQQQDVFAIGVTGSPFSLPAGDVQVAFGAEHRREAVSATSDAVSQAGGWRQINAKPLDGSYTVNEGYLEVGVPLLEDVAFARELDVNGAVRFTDYSTSGSVVTWKAGVNYTPFYGVRLRGTVSRDIRAPSVNELFSGQAQAVPLIIDPVTNKSQATPVLTGGNPDLAPEKADTWTVGAVLQPGFLPGFQVSVDYYSIKINEAISALEGQDVVDACYIDNQTNLCSAITRDSTNTITLVQATLFNAETLSTDGVDIEALYRTDLGGGALTARSLVTYVHELKSSATGDLAGVPGSNGPPHWRGNVGVNWRGDKLRFGALFRFVQGGLYNARYVEGGGPNSINNNHLGSRGYVDVNASYELTDNFEVFGKINNLLDNDPPVSVIPITASTAARSVFYDRVGRFVTGGVRFQF